MLDRLTWLGHSGFFLQGPPNLYVDPFRIGGGPPADLILLTHPHYDHCSPADLARITTEETEILCPADCLTALRELPGTRRLVEPGLRVELEGLHIEAVPAYTRRSRMHGRDQAWVGYIVERDGIRWYHAGDTDYIPEMRAMRVDIACLPISGGETMTVVEAAAAANCLSPQVAIPMHYGIIGNQIDPDLFGNLTRVAVRTMERDPAFAGE
jgi:L-ascorbate metabolism protein UlaG (beta-lactamase superfamily)